MEFNEPAVLFRLRVGAALIYGPRCTSNLISPLPFVLPVELNNRDGRLCLKAEFDSLYVNYYLNKAGGKHLTGFVEGVT